jgi:hypothetical protein
MLSIGIELRICFRKEKASDHHFGPKLLAAHTGRDGVPTGWPKHGPTRDAGARSRPTQQAAHGGDARAVVLQKNPCTNRKSSDSVNHYFHRLTICDQALARFHLRNTAVHGTPALADVVMAGTVWPLRPPRGRNGALSGRRGPTSQRATARSETEPHGALPKATRDDDETARRLDCSDVLRC